MIKEFEIPNDKGGYDKEEIMATQADEFCGVIAWSRYLFADKTLFVQFRLDDRMYVYYNVPADEYERFKAAALSPLTDEEKYVEEFNQKYERVELD